MKDLGQFETKKELFEYLVENKTKLINMKKSTRKYSDSAYSSSVAKKSEETTKGHVEGSDLIKTIVGNTYNWMDSHDDVHLKNTFTKSISEKSKDVFHLHDHKFELDAIVGEPRKIFEQEIAWKSLGVNKSGTTQSLMMESKIIDDNKPNIFNAYKNGKINQHSVGMQYVKLELAINDENEEEEFKVWNDHIDKIANKEKAEERGFFWAVQEAKLIEISAVLRGSNELTPTIEGKQEPSYDTPEVTEAAKALQEMRQLLTNLNI